MAQAIPQTSKNMKMEVYHTNISLLEETLLLRLLHKFMMTAQKGCLSNNGDLWVESQETKLLLDTKDLITLVGLLDKVTLLRQYINKVNQWIEEK